MRGIREEYDMRMFDSLVQNGDALRMYGMSGNTSLWDDVLSGTWVWALWTIFLLVVILLVSVGSLNEKNFVSRLASLVHGAPARDLFYRFNFIELRAPDANIAYINKAKSSGYLRYIDLGKVMFITDHDIPKGRRLEFRLNALPGFYSDELMTVCCEVRQSRQIKDDYLITARIVDMMPQQKALLDDYLQRFQAARSRRA